MPRKIGLVIAPLVLGMALLGAGADGAAPPPTPTPPPPPLVTYELAESRLSRTPVGETARSLRGVVHVLAGSARWELARGAFPRTRARVALVGPRSSTLVAPDEAVEATAGPEAFAGLFREAGGAESGLSASRVADVEVVVSPAGAGAPFQGEPTRRFRVSVGYSVVTSIPGQMLHVVCRTTGSIETLAAGDGAASPLDDLGRLFDVPPEVAEELAPRLAKVDGLPVAVALETEARRLVEGVGPGGGEAESLVPPRPTTTTVERHVTGLVRRASTPADRSLFEAGDAVRSVAWERLVRDDEVPR